MTGLELTATICIVVAVLTVAWAIISQARRIKKLGASWGRAGGHIEITMYKGTPEKPSTSEPPAQAAKRHRHRPRTEDRRS